MSQRTIPRCTVLLSFVAVAFCAPALAMPGVQRDWGWVDADADGKADKCRALGENNGTLRCTLSTGTGFGLIFGRTHTDLGYGAGRAWVDFNGDGRADYCRVVGGWYKNLQCTVSEGFRFGDTFTSGAVDPGYDAGRAWVDVNADNKADYCRVVGAWDKRLECTLSTGDGFGAGFRSGVVDPGFDAGRLWADVNGDNRADYCRVVGPWSKSIQCTLTTGSGFGQTFTSAPLDPGWDESRKLADFSGDGKADYCRIIGSLGDQKVQCTVSTGLGFGATFTSQRISYQNNGTPTWVDVNADNKADYCREESGPIALCTLSLGARTDGRGFGDTFTHRPGQLSGEVGFADFNGDARADYCRTIKVNDQQQLSCTLSTGTAFGETFTGAGTIVILP